MIRPIMLVAGTRPEAIKLIPVHLALKQANISTVFCATFQHAELSEQVFSIFNIVPDFNLNIMKKDQDLFYLTATMLEKMKEVYLQVNPSLLLVHGDTTTTFAAALAAFYLNIPVGHVEAGLRTGNMRAPFPEEMNRKVVGQIASYHFAPTAFSTAHLLAEGIDRRRIFCTGNTVVDALHMISKKIDLGELVVETELQAIVQAAKKANRKIILLTAHRRESFGGGLCRVFSAVKQFALLCPDALIIYPQHPNPTVIAEFNQSELATVPNLYKTTSISYKDMVYLLTQVDFVVTDSGGLQEEAVSLGKSALVLRDITERWEGVWDGSEVLVGTNGTKILEAMLTLYEQQNDHEIGSTVYGDGKACQRIVSIIKNIIVESNVEKPVIINPLAFGFKKVEQKSI